MKGYGMIIILEGPDGAGKTTLAIELVRKLHERKDKETGVRLLHRGPPRWTTYEMEYLLPLRTFEKPHVVCDRWHVGDIVYGPIFRDGPLQDARRFRALERELHRMGALVVLCTDTPDALRARITGRGPDDYLGDDLDVLDDIVDEYDEWYVSTSMNVMRWGIGDGADRILARAEGAA